MIASIFNTLERSNATLVDTRALPQRASTATWINTFDQIHYEGPRQHAVSVYLDGGAQARRQGFDGTGWPGAICILPEGSYSDWEISGPFRFAHVYFSDEILARFAVEALNIDPRGLSLPDQSFVDSRDLRLAMHNILTSQTALHSEMAMSELLAALAAHCGRRCTIRGGLSRKAARLTTDYLRANLDAPVRLSTLAGLVGLSEFHFQRMFKAQFGCSPQRWHEALRIEDAKRRISAGEGLADIAAACGFAHQSHLTRVFNAMTGTTPSAYRNLLKI